MEKEKIIKRCISDIRKVVSANKGDFEVIHSECENILCDLLVQLGFDKVVKEYNKQEKYYS